MEGDNGFKMVVCDVAEVFDQPMQPLLLEDIVGYSRTRGPVDNCETH